MNECSCGVLIDNCDDMCKDCEDFQRNKKVCFESGNKFLKWRYSTVCDGFIFSVNDKESSSLDSICNTVNKEIEKLQSKNEKLKECLVEAENDLYEICLHNTNIKSNSLVKLTRLLKELKKRTTKHKE